MGGGGREQRLGVFAFGVILFFLTAYLARDSVEVLLRPPTHQPLGSVPVREINDSAFLAVIAWCLASPFAVWGPLTRCRAQADRVRYGRLLYTWACALTLLHIAVAFHAAHGWSHERAYQHVETASGFGPGLYVNYAFVLVWVLDVLWAWVRSRNLPEPAGLACLVLARFHGVHRLQRGGGVRHGHAAAGERGTVRHSAVCDLGRSAAGTAIDHLLVLDVS